MQTNFQEYEVNVRLRYTSEVFEGDPNDVYELADLERATAVTAIQIAFPDSELYELTVDPVIGE